MARMNMDDLIVTLDSIKVALTQVRDATIPKIQETVELWAEASKLDAKNALRRDEWKLTRSIASKVKRYPRKGKYWAMVGFGGGAKNKRSPGAYGRYWESGQAQSRRPNLADVPSGFLRAAKAKNLAELEKGMTESMELAAKKLKAEIGMKRLGAKLRRNAQR